MRNIFQYKKIDAAIMLSLIVLWLVSFKSSALFSFFGTYSSLWYLPAGITLSIALAVPLRFIIAPLIANWLLAVPIVSALLHVEYTSVADHLLHGTRLFLVYAGAGCLLRYGLKIQFPVSNLSDQLKVILVTLIASLLGAASGVSLHVTMGSFDWDVARNIFLPWMIGDGIAAVIVPPLLVPLLIRLFASDEQRAHHRNLSSVNMLGFQMFTILLTMYVAFGVSPQLSEQVELWYVVVLPPIIFAVRGGIPNAATAIAITALLTPPIATLFGFDGERISLQFLLLIGGVFSLMIGGAITDRDNALEIIKLHESELESQIADRTEKLQKAYEFQQHLIRSIGHDIQQPHYAINNMVSALKLMNTDKEMIAPLSQTKDLVQVAMGVTQKILDYAKREVGQVTTFTKRFKVQKVFDQVEKSFEFEVDQRSIQLNFVPTDLDLISDEHLVWEVITNLVQNSIRLSRKAGSVDVIASYERNWLVITVTDEVTNREDQSGQAGFGLEIVRQISELLDFEYSLEPNCARIRFKNSTDYYQ